jgi:hypothetical protein
MRSSSHCSSNVLLHAVTRTMARHIKHALAALVVLVVVPGSAIAQSVADAPANKSWQPVEGQRWGLGQSTAGRSPDFRGLASQDRAAGSVGGMLYPAPSAAGLLVAILTHAAISESVKSANRTAVQKEADAVLLPYKPVLDVWSMDDLMLRTRTHLKASQAPMIDLFSDGESMPAAWLIESVPVFYITADHRAVIVDAEVSARRSDLAQVEHKALVRVVGTPTQEADAQASWSAQDGERLRAESTKLHAAAISLAMQDMLGLRADAGARQRTIRYHHGGEEIIERAQLLERQCKRLVIRSLRGDLLSVPLSDSMADSVEETKPCGAAPG